MKFKLKLSKADAHSSPELGGLFGLEAEVLVAVNLERLVHAHTSLGNNCHLHFI